MKDGAFRALVVDDEPIVRRCVMHCLDAAGFQCDAAGDGNEALQMLEASHYDVVISDLKMPYMNGHALVVNLLQRSDRPLIVVLTAVDDPRLTKDLVLRGVEDVMFKRIHPETFAAKVSALVQRRRTGSAQQAADQGTVQIKT